MAINDFKPIAIPGSANSFTNAQYATFLAANPNGWPSGIVPAPRMNKALRQSSVIAAAVAQFIVNTTSQSVLDPDTGVDPAVIAAQLLAAVQAAVGGAAPIPAAQLMTTSGTYTPTAGMRAIFVIAKAGGASGGGTNVGTAFGGGGGEGELAIALFTAGLIGGGQTVTINPGGAAIPANTNIPGINGGSTSFGALLTAIGGVRGTDAASGGQGGQGGSGGVGGLLHIPGDAGHSGSDASGATLAINAPGGGDGGSQTTSAGAVANSGGGGGGGTPTYPSGYGAAGYCLIIELF